MDEDSDSECEQDVDENETMVRDCERVGNWVHVTSTIKYSFETCSMCF